ncbi:MAG: hypothetical protein AAB388_01290 [Patescibacteria group bacterium]
MSADKQSTEYQNVTIDTVSGLDLFLTHIRDVYQTGLPKKSASLKKQPHRSVADRNHKFLRTYKELQHGIMACKKSLLAGKEVTTAEAGKLQTLYDQLLSLRDSSLHETAAKKTPAVVPVASTAKNETHAPSSAFATDALEKSQSTVPTHSLREKKIHPLARRMFQKEVRETKRPLETARLTATPTPSPATSDKKKKEDTTHDKDKQVPTSTNPSRSASPPTPVTFTPQSARVRSSAQPAPPPRPTFTPTSTKKAKNPSATAAVRPLESGIVQPDPIHEKRSLTAIYLNRPEYRQFIADNYSSPAGFEKIIDSTITAIERTLTDPIERWLGEVHASPFAYLESMTLSDITEFNQQPYEFIKSVLAKENIKYEGYVLWVDLIPEMLRIVDAHTDITFGELFARYLIENEMLRSA